MKKTLCMLLVMVMAFSILAGCGAKPAEVEKPASTAAEAQAPAENKETAKTWEEMGLKHPLQDVRIRQALTMAIDRDTIIAGLFQGKAERAYSLTSPGPWMAEGLEPYDYNPEAAKALLKEAGWPSNYTMDVVYYYADQQTVDLMTVIGQYWSEVGVKAQFRKLEGDLNSQLWVKPADVVNGPSEVKWDMAYGAVSALTENEFYERLTSTAGNNSYLPKNDAMDAAVFEMVGTADPDAQMAACKEAQRINNENQFVMPLYHQVLFIVTSDKLDMKGNEMGNEQFCYEKNILDWEIARDDNTMYTNGGPVELFETPAINPGQYPYQEFVWERLLNADENLNATDGQLAESYSYNETMDVLTLNLREGVKWHDGEAFDAEDVKYTLEMYLKMPSANSNITTPLKTLKGAQDYIDGKADHVEGIKVDGMTVILEQTKIAPTMLTALAQWPILPEHLLKNADVNTIQMDPYWQKPIGTGPYKIDEVKMGNYATMVRNPDYWRTGTGNIETIYMFSSQENDINLVKNAGAGKIDYAWSKSVDDAIAIEKIDGMTVTPAKIRYTRLFYFNEFPHEANIK